MQDTVADREIMARETEPQRLARLLHAELRACGVRYVAGVPDIETNALWQCFVQDDNCRVITASREGEALGICGGLHLAGERPLFCVKNFGLFESLDTLRMIVSDWGTPLIMFVGYAGRPVPGVAETLRSWLGNGASHVLLAGDWTEKVLRAIDVPYHVVDNAEGMAEVRAAITKAIASSRPLVLLGQMP